MLAFGRGIFTATVVSTFILLLVSFYPSDFYDALSDAPTAIHVSNLQSIEASAIMEMCEQLELQLSINRIALKQNQELEIHYTISDRNNDYGLLDSYNLSQQLFKSYEQLMIIDYKIYLDNAPILLATINKNTASVTEVNHQYRDVLTELQKSFSIVLLN